MSRDEACEVLRAVHPGCLQLAILRQVLTGEERTAESAAFYGPVAAREITREAGYWYAALRHHATQVAPERVKWVPPREDLVELLTSEVPEVRLLGLRLMGRL